MVARSTIGPPSAFVLERNSVDALSNRAAVGRVSVILLKNDWIVAAVSIPRIVDIGKLHSRYGKRGYKHVCPAFFSRIFHTRHPRGQQV
jgi:hypothetical protein